MALVKPPIIEREVIIQTVLLRKDAVCNNGKIVSATSEVWIALSDDLERKLKPTSLHSLVANNRYNLKEKLLGIESVRMELSEVDEALTESAESLNSNSPREYIFAFTIPTLEFKKLVGETVYGKKRLRSYTVLRQQLWTETIAAKMYEQVDLRHAIHFKNHYMSRSGSSGRITGKLIYICICIIIILIILIVIIIILLVYLECLS